MVPVVLFAEDNPDDVVLIRKVLEPWTSETDPRFVGDGAEAIAYLRGVEGFADRGLHPLPEVIFMDIHMPRLNGLEALGWIRSQPKFDGTPTVIVSSSSEMRDMREAYAAGANAYLIKASAFERFSKVVSEACRFFLAVQRPGLLSSSDLPRDVAA